MRVLVLLLLSAFLSASTFAQIVDEDVARISDNELAQALTLYEAEPLSPRGADAAVTAMNYAAQSPRIEVVFFEEATPWIINDAAGNPTSELMAAFVVGNVKAQLSSGRMGTDSYAGSLEVIRVYNIFQAKRPDFRMPDVERFITMEKEHKLKAFLNDVDKRNRQSMAAEKERPEKLPPGQLKRLLEKQP